MLSVIVPVYNGEKVVESAINLINSLPVEKEIIVVNDCSNDRTEAILKSLTFDNFKVIHHASRRGKAAAVRTGIDNVTGDFIVFQSIDSEFNPKHYTKLLEAMSNQAVDIVLGRSATGAAKDGVVVKLSNYVSSFFLNVLFNVRIKDWFSGCKLIRKERLLGLLHSLNSSDVEFEILTKAIRKKLAVVEVII